MCTPAANRDVPEALGTRGSAKDLYVRLHAHAELVFSLQSVTTASGEEVCLRVSSPCRALTRATTVAITAEENE